MPKPVFISIKSLGWNISGVNLEKISRWKSQIFSVAVSSDVVKLNTNADLDNWEYSDDNLQDVIKRNTDSHQEQGVDFTVYVTSVPLEDNHFSRVINEDLVVITTYEVYEILALENIPLENFVIAMMYVYTLEYQKCGRLLNMNEERIIAHDNRDGCLFDMCGLKGDVISKCVRPYVCNECIEKLGLSEEEMSCLKKEFRKIKRTHYQTILRFIKKYPILSILISGIFGILINIISNLLYDWCKSVMNQ